MPRPRRILPVGWAVHIVNRGVERRPIFLQRSDYIAFAGSLADAARRFAVDLDGYCCLTTHFHLVVRQREPYAIVSYLHRISTLSAMRLREGTGTVGFGHVYQRRYWSQVLADAEQYVATLRYVEDNARRAGLVSRAEHWEWGSLWERVTAGRRLLTPPAVSLPPDWVSLVNKEQPPDVLEAIRRPAKRGRPRAASSPV